MADDQKDTGGFDDWLEEEPGPDTDPYAALADDDEGVESEIADWMAFTEGTASSEEPEDEPAEAPDPQSLATAGPESDADVADEPEAFDADELVVIPAVDTPDTSDDREYDAQDETGEIAVAPPSDAPSGTDDEQDDEQEETVPATSVDLGDWHGEDRADTDEIPIVAAADVVEASVTNLNDQRPDEVHAAHDGEVHEDTGEIEAVDAESDADDDHDDTGDMDVVDFPSPADDDTNDDVFAEGEAAARGAGFAELWDGVPAAPDDLDTGGEVEDTFDSGADAPFDISSDDYLQTATRDHAGLAAAIAEAEEEETEQVALAAPIPGLEATVVGFDDVVEAEGHSKARARRSGDLVARVITGVVLIVAFFASLVWRPALIALATVVFVIGAGEFYTALARSGRKPVSIFGFLGIIGATVGGFVWGVIAIPVSFLLVTAMLLLYYAVVPGRRDPIGNLALTVTIMAWVGLGAFAGPIAVSDDYRVLIIGVVITVALMDIAQYFVGTTLGRHQLAPWVSPKKSIEGLVGGVIVALALGALLEFIDPFDLSSGLAIGAAAAVLVPMGDLAMSAAKRSLGLKDMGSILPGHGGFLDRIDGLLFTIPAAWAIFTWAGLL